MDDKTEDFMDIQFKSLDESDVFDKSKIDLVTKTMLTIITEINKIRKVLISDESSEKIKENYQKFKLFVDLLKIYEKPSIIEFLNNCIEKKKEKLEREKIMNETSINDIGDLFATMNTNINDVKNESDTETNENSDVDEEMETDADKFYDMMDKSLNLLKNDTMLIRKYQIHRDELTKVNYVNILTKKN